MKTVKVRITGTTPLLMHADNIEWSDKMDEWKNDPKNKAMSKAGDDRTPPYRWTGYLNHDGNNVTIPSEYVMRCIMNGAAEVPTGKKGKTFKSQSQSGLVCRDFHWPLYINGSLVAMDDIKDLIPLETFREHTEMVTALGFSLFVKRAKIGQSKHVRVRPRFDNWAIENEITITDDQITKELLAQFLEIAGRYKGLGDWRPGAKTPGPWGMFEAVVTS